MNFDMIYERLKKIIDDKHAKLCVEFFQVSLEASENVKEIVCEYSLSKEKQEFNASINKIDIGDLIPTLEQDCVPPYNTPHEIAQAYKGESILLREYDCVSPSFTKSLKTKCKDDEMNAEFHISIAASWYTIAISTKNAVEMKAAFTKCAENACIAEKYPFKHIRLAASYFGAKSCHYSKRFSAFMLWIDSGNSILAKTMGKSYKTMFKGSMGVPGKLCYKVKDEQEEISSVPGCDDVSSIENKDGNGEYGNPAGGDDENESSSSDDESESSSSDDESETSSSCDDESYTESSTTFVMLQKEEWVILVFVMFGFLLILMSIWNYH